MGGHVKPQDVGMNNPPIQIAPLNITSNVNGRLAEIGVWGEAKEWW